MTEFNTPRINKALLEHFVGTPVRLVGKVLQSKNNECIVESSDRQEVRLTLLASEQVLELGQHAEFIGKVEKDLSISVQFFTNFGKQFDLENYDQLVELANLHHQLFIRGK